MNSNLIGKAVVEKKIVLVTGDAFTRACNESPDARFVVNIVVDAVLGKWKMSHTPAGQASLLAKLRRFMPARPVDASLRKAFGLTRDKAHIGHS